MRNKTIHFVKCEGLWIELCKFDLIILSLKNDHMQSTWLDFDKKLVGNLDKIKFDQCEFIRDVKLHF